MSDQAMAGVIAVYAAIITALSLAAGEYVATVVGGVFTIGGIRSLCHSRRV